MHFGDHLFGADVFLLDGESWQVHPDDYAGGANCFDRPGEALYGVYVGPCLVAVGGLNCDPYLLDGHTGRVRHVYVLSAFRRRGVDPFYRALGFRTEPPVPNATHHLDLEEKEL